jgi:predicted NBD/HSP70 family sugar kinase
MENTNNSEVRINNIKRVINILFHQGPMTKQELALKLGISLPTVTVIIKELTKRGLITNGEVLKSTGGRKPVRITPVFDAKYAIGIEVSTNELRIVLVDLGPKKVAVEKYPLGVQNTREYWEQVNSTLMDFIDRNLAEKEKLLGVGITLQVPIKDQRIVLSKNMSPNLCIDLKMAEGCFNIPVEFYSSGKMAAISQIWALNEWDNFIFLSIDSYMAGAFIHNGEIVGFPDRNGEFGNMLINRNGSREKFEDYCTSRAICNKSGLSVKEFFASLEQGNEDCIKIWDEYLDILSICLHNIHCIFDWDIFIGGSMSEYIEKYRAELRSRLDALTDFSDESTAYVKISDLGVFGPAVGAALTQNDRFLNFDYE